MSSSDHSTSPATAPEALAERIEPEFDAIAADLESASDSDALQALTVAARSLMLAVHARLGTEPSSGAIPPTDRLAKAFTNALQRIGGRLPVLEGQSEKQASGVVTLAWLCGQPPGTFESYRLWGALDDLLDNTGIMACLAEVAHRDEQIAARSGARGRSIAILEAMRATPGTAPPH